MTEKKKCRFVIEVFLPNGEVRKYFSTVGELTGGELEAAMDVFRTANNMQLEVISASNYEKLILVLTESMYKNVFVTVEYPYEL